MLERNLYAIKYVFPWWGRTEIQNLDGKLDWKHKCDIHEKQKWWDRKNAETCREEKRKATQIKQNIQPEDINLNVLLNEGRLKRYQVKIKQYRQNMPFHNN